MPIPFEIIKKLTCCVLVLAVFGCNHATKQQDKKIVKQTQKAKPKEYKEVKYTEPQLIAFFDSVGKLPVQPLVNKAAFWADSIFENFTEPMQRGISQPDFENLKKAIQAKFIDVHTAKQIFGKLNVDTGCNANGLLDSVPKGTLRLHYYNFSRTKNKFYEYGVRIGDPEHCRSGSQLFYLKNDTIIAQQNGDSRYFDDDVKSFINVDGEAIVYRLIEFDHGSGIWWLNSFFYKYDGDKIIPVLNELKNSNLLQPSPWGTRELWLESTVKSTNPLVMKVVYHQQFPDTTEYDHYVTDPKPGPMIVNDSTLVKYIWNAKTKKLESQLEQSKINRHQILSYYLVDNEILFINAYHQRIKQIILNKNKKKSVLHYLNIVKNHQNELSER